MKVTCENQIPAILRLIKFHLECFAAVLVDNATQYKYVLGGLPSDLDSSDTLNAINGAQCLADRHLIIGMPMIDARPIYNVASHHSKQWTNSFGWLTRVDVLKNTNFFG